MEFDKFVNMRPISKKPDSIILNLEKKSKQLIMNEVFIGI